MNDYHERLAKLLLEKNEQIVPQSGANMGRVNVG